MNLIRVALQRGLLLCQNERGCDFAHSPHLANTLFRRCSLLLLMSTYRVCECVCVNKGQGGGSIYIRIAEVWPASTLLMNHEA